MQPICKMCGHGVPEQKPVYLIMDSSGMILGPLHSGCAWKLSERIKRGEAVLEGPFDIYGKRVLPAREETLPE